jgi:hypothetical protein
VKGDAHRGKKRIVYCGHQETVEQQPMSFAKWKLFCVSTEKLLEGGDGGEVDE